MPGSYAEFTRWWAERMHSLRRATGFEIEVAYGIPETEEFAWAVSVPGDRAAFLALDAAYLASARAQR